MDYRLTITLKNTRFDDEKDFEHEDKLIFVRPVKIRELFQDIGFLGEYLRSLYDVDDQFRRYIDEIR